MNSRLYPDQGLHGGILHELGRAIAGGQFAEGMLLPTESELQERFGASRQTVREAIKVLAAKGMVRARKRAGTSVQPRANWNLLDPDVLHWHPRGALT
jgi:DNA-binding FadR family transcriptional regulator